eukprot:4103975-Alexandrium_andersonii.AAC.1
MNCSEPSFFFPTSPTSRNHHRPQSAKKAQRNAQRSKNLPAKERHQAKARGQARPLCCPGPGGREKKERDDSNRAREEGARGVATNKD